MNPDNSSPNQPKNDTTEPSNTATPTQVTDNNPLTQLTGLPTTFKNKKTPWIIGIGGEIVIYLCGIMVFWANHKSGLWRFLSIFNGNADATDTYKGTSLKVALIRGLIFPLVFSIIIGIALLFRKQISRALKVRN